MNTTATNPLSGLTDEEVLQSRAEHGSNILSQKVEESLFRKFCRKFRDPLIVILLIAGTLSLGISLYDFFLSNNHQGDWGVFFEPAGIFVAVFMATGLTFYFETKANKEFDLLNQVNDDEPVQVIRNGHSTEIPKKDVVVGDIVVLGNGCEIPADGELLESTSLNVDESTLTGEPICSKTIITADFDSNATFPSNQVMRGTKVMEGHGLFRVTAVGDDTENGKVFVATQIDNSVKTPLSEQLENLAGKISLTSYILAALIVVGRTLHFLLSTPSYDWIEMVSHFLQTLMIAVTVIVVAVPEGLPMAVTLSLAYSMRRMFKANNLVRKMHACETMGATTIICTDKTGTLTKNQMRVNEMHALYSKTDPLDQEEKNRLLVEGIAVNSTATLEQKQGEAEPHVLGNPTEGALLLWLHGENIDFKKIKAEANVMAELPFTTERKFMAVVVRSTVTGRPTLYVKGAPEVVMALCSDTGGNIAKTDIEQQLRQYQQKAMRTLAFAYRVLEDGEMPIAENRLTAGDLCLIGFVAISDPVRSDVPAAVGQCLTAGIGIKIVTGDTSATAKEIAREIGLWQEGDGERNIITGPELAALDEQSLVERILDLKIISRARPMDKKRLVETLQKLQQVVAVTGDGTNDAPALKAAHVGLSMGDGTSVAKEASDITIIDNSFASITRAVMWGRSLYQNIQRFILFQMTINVVACLIVLIGAFIGEQSPLTVTQMLWVNLIMDTFAAMALASLPPTESVMNDRPRSRTAFIITPAMSKRIVGTGLLFTAMLLALIFIFQNFDITRLTDFMALNQHLNSDGRLSPTELSIIFTTFVMLQFWNMFNARAFLSGRSAFHLKGCRGFLLIALLIVIGQIVIVNFGGKMFSVTPLSISDWLIITGTTSFVLWVGEAARILGSRTRLKSFGPQESDGKTQPTA